MSLETPALQVKIDMLHSDMVEMKAVLNKMSEALTKLALVEQQLEQTSEALNRAFKLVSKIEDRVTALESGAAKTKETTIWLDRFLLGVASAIGSFAAYKLGLFH
jgi:chromosome segregation ATPase